MSSGTAGSVHLLGSRLNLAHVWEASRRDLLRVLGPGDSKVCNLVCHLIHQYIGGYLN